MVQGDTVRLRIHCGAETLTFLGTQASSRVYRHLDAKTASQEIDGTLEADALAVVFPDPLVLHADSRFRQKQNWNIAPSASLVLGDWFQCGRSDSGEQFAYTSWETEIALRVAGKLAVLDRFRSEPPREDPRLPGRFGANNLLLNLYVLGPVASALAEILSPFTAFEELHQIPASQSAPQLPRPFASLNKLENADGFVMRAVGHTREDFQPLIAALFAHLAAPSLLGFNPLARKY
jgi:urease accessory protein